MSDWGGTRVEIFLKINNKIVIKSKNQLWDGNHFSFDFKFGSAIYCD